MACKMNHLATLFVNTWLECLGCKMCGNWIAGACYFSVYFTGDGPGLVTRLVYCNYLDYLKLLYLYL